MTRQFRAIELGRLPGYWEAFVGSGWVLHKVHGGNIYASDIHHYLMEMWIALQKGWRPPEKVTEHEYNLAKQQAKEDVDNGFSDAELGFIGFGASFGGKWWGGFARDSAGERDVPYEGARALLYKYFRIDKGTQFFEADFLTTEPLEKEMVIYCDIPYESTTEYSMTFDHARFWDKVRRHETEGHVVLVSEYQAPEDFSCILEIPTTTTVGSSSGSGQKRVERLFRYGNHAPVQPRLL